MNTTEISFNEEPVIAKGHVVLELRNVKTGRVIIEHYDNMIVTLGKNGIAGGLIQESGKGYITYCALGTSVVAPALADTGLTTEIFRKAISVRSRSNNQATFQTFFTTSEAVGTLREAALFGDSTASETANSGNLYAKVAINRTKTTNDTLTLSWTITVG